MLIDEQAMMRGRSIWATARPLVGVLLRCRDGAAAVEFALLLPFMAFLFVTTTDALRAMTVARRTTNAVDTIAQMISQTDDSSSNSNNTVLDSDIQLAFDSIPTTFPDVLSDSARQGQTSWTQDITVVVSSAIFTGTPAGCTPIRLTSTNPSTQACTGASAVIGWSAGNNGTSRNCGPIDPTTSTAYNPLFLPASLYYGTSSYIVVDLTYTYKPLFVTVFNGNLPSFLSGPLTFHKTAYLPPRYYKQLLLSAPSLGVTSANNPTCNSPQSGTDTGVTPNLTGCVCTS